MAKVVECVPNFSEGKDRDKIKKIVAAIESIPSVILLDIESDVNHNRSVVSFVGSPEVIVEAAFASCKVASQLIDLNRHKGEHPRMGATDVIPLIPIAEVTLAECVTLSYELGQRIGEELSIPVFFYEASALRPDRENLADVRAGEFEGLREEIGKNLSKIPDEGPNKIHPTAGVTAIGARMPLIAFNINLDTTDVHIAKEIAKAVRFKDGGFRYVKALGFDLPDRKLVQVSMNMTNYQKTPLCRVFEVVKAEAARRGVSVVESEIVGLTPREVILDTTRHYLQLENFDKKQILEDAIRYKTDEKDKTLDSFLEELSAKTATPGGGSVAALLGALSASLFLMVLRFSVKQTILKEMKEEILNSCNLVEKIRHELKEDASKDAYAYEQLVSSKKRVKNARPNDIISLEVQYKSKVKEAYQVPLSVLVHLEELVEIVKKWRRLINPKVSSDLYVGLCVVEAAAQSAHANVLVNLGEVSLKSEVTKIKKWVDRKKSSILKSLQKLKVTIKI